MLLKKLMRRKEERKSCWIWYQNIFPECTRKLVAWILRKYRMHLRSTDTTDVFIQGIRFWKEFQDRSCKKFGLSLGHLIRRELPGCHIAAASLGSRVPGCLKVYPHYNILVYILNPARLECRSFSFSVHITAHYSLLLSIWTPLSRNEL